MHAAYTRDVLASDGFYILSEKGIDLNNDTAVRELDNMVWPFLYEQRNETGTNGGATSGVMAMTCVRAAGRQAAGGPSSTSTSSSFAQPTAAMLAGWGAGSSLGVGAFAAAALAAL
jgi:hypothetical protein